jgi:hypothetical protein
MNGILKQITNSLHYTSDANKEKKRIDIELASQNFETLHGYEAESLASTLTVYNPYIFSKIIQSEEGNISFVESLNITKNHETIVKAGVSKGGKSGEFFLRSFDNKLIIKSIPEKEK